MREDSNTCRDLEMALSLYQSLIDSGWNYIPPFRDLVKLIGESKEASGLVVVTSMATLIFSPYTSYPDWFEGRNVQMTPLRDGRVKIVYFPGQFAGNTEQSWTVTIDQADAIVRPLIAEL